MRRVYLDYSATTPLDPLVLDAMRPHFLENYGNASSIHQAGREARAALEEARESLAGHLGTTHDTLFFTSGGTEADNFAVFGVSKALLAKERDHVVVSAIEHHAVLHAALALRKQGYRVDVAPVDRTGVVDLEALERLVTDRTSLVSVMHANNETGTVQPVRDAGRIARRRGALLHSDAVQTLGKIGVSVDELGADLLSVSAHKIYGPKGIGALYIRKGSAVESLLVGGGQEQNRRAGTENVPLAVGFATAADIAMERLANDARRLGNLRGRLRQMLVDRFSGIIVNTDMGRSVPGILNVSFDSSSGEVDGEALIMGMDLRGVAVTSGSACTSGTLEPSHVLLAMGRDIATSRATIRFSLGRPTTEDELRFALDALADVLRSMKQTKQTAGAEKKARV